MNQRLKNIAIESRPPYISSPGFVQRIIADQEKGLIFWQEMAEDTHENLPECVHIPLGFGEKFLIGIMGLRGVASCGADDARHRSFCGAENPAQGYGQQRAPCRGRESA